MQGFVSLDPASTIAIPEAIGFGIDDSSFNIPQLVIALIAMTGHDTGVRQLTPGGCC
jgi:hypothetical protein